MIDYHTETLYMHELSAFKSSTASSLYNRLNDRKAFTFSNNVYYQADLPVGQAFETHYTALRAKEGRLYTDDVLRKLPLIAPSHPLSKEWVTRARSTYRLLQYLATHAPGARIMDVGCGNGWLTHRLANLLGTQVLGVDVNETELKQAARVFRRSNLLFLYGDIFFTPLPPRYFHIIVLAGCIQYFVSLPELLTRLRSLLCKPAEIHIIDSPVYRYSEVRHARGRSEQYFKNCGFGEQIEFYHHHSWEELDGFNYELLYDPSRMSNRLKQRLSSESPFPWIKVLFPTE